VLGLVGILPKERRVRNIILGPFEMRANEEKDIEYRLHVMGNMMMDTIHKYLHCNKRRGTLGGQSVMNIN
jgi:hypothetical protein